MKRTDGANRRNTLAQLESLLQKEEEALGELEKRVTEHRQVLIAGDARSILSSHQRIEEALGRIGQLEAAREGLVAGLAHADTSSGTSITGILAVAGGADPSVTERLLCIRRRIVEAVARVARSNESNGRLVAGLRRTTGAATDRLSQWRSLESAASAGSTEVGIVDLTHSGPRVAGAYRSIAVDTRA